MIRWLAMTVTCLFCLGVGLGTVRAGHAMPGFAAHAGFFPHSATAATARTDMPCDGGHTHALQPDPGLFRPAGVSVWALTQVPALPSPATHYPCPDCAGGVAGVSGHVPGQHLAHAAHHQHTMPCCDTGSQFSAMFLSMPGIPPAMFWHLREPAPLSAATVLPGQRTTPLLPPPRPHAA
ncbi:MAG: hypothetical protein ABF990_06230 [Acetobacter sp.]|uniref:hypothetical protein n=1 Tax=Acetobacter sp. TaxID=440 RepID=UPI0039E73DFD